jgi:hypothetical protein
MKVGDFVQWNLAQFHGVDFTPARGWIVAVEGDWVVIRVSNVRHPQVPFATLHRKDLSVVPQSELVRRGATLLS